MRAVIGLSVGLARVAKPALMPFLPAAMAALAAYRTNQVIVRSVLALLWLESVAPELRGALLVHVEPAVTVVAEHSGDVVIVEYLFGYLMYVAACADNKVALAKVRAVLVYT